MAVHEFVKGIKNGFDSLTGKKGKKNFKERDTEIFGADLPFDSAESYKLLRANLGFSLPEGDGCRVIAVTSSMRGEGKSTISINLAYTIAQTGKKVLLIDCDMRLPSVAKKLKLVQRPGLSNALVGLSSLEDSIRHSTEVSSWDILPSGSIPPNPSELLGTKSMENLMDHLRKQYDTIIVDLPPVTIVSDAMVISNLVDGYILVVRQDYSDKSAVCECIKLMDVLKSKILGFVVTGSTKNEKGYYYKRGRYYGRYYKGYYRKHYGNGYGYGHGNGYGYGNGYGDRSGYGNYGYAKKTTRSQEFMEANQNTIYQSSEEGKNE